MFVAAASWPAFYGMQFLRRNKALTGTWIVSCLIMSSFTLLPAIKVEDITIMCVESFSFAECTF